MNKSTYLKITVKTNSLI